MRVDVLLVGGGVAGLATAWWLARREPRVRVLLVERERTLGAMASGQNAAILRTFGADARLNELARRSARFLQEPPAGFADVPLIERTGLLLFASGPAADALRAARAADDGARELDARERARYAPHVDPRARAADLALAFDAEGRIDVASLLEALARGARAGGVELVTGTSVTRLLGASGCVHGAELSSGAKVEAKTTVLAAGAWAGSLGAAVGSSVDLRPTRRHLMVTAPDPTLDPGLPVVWVEDAGFYCRPESGGMLLSACDISDVDPDHATRDPSVAESIAIKAATHLVDFERARAAHFWHGLRTLTRDDRFCIGPDPDVEGLWWVAGLGGHGMTCGVEAGRLAAWGILGGTDEEWLAPARLVASGAQ